MWMTSVLLSNQVLMINKSGQFNYRECASTCEKPCRRFCSDPPFCPCFLKFSSVVFSENFEFCLSLSVCFGLQTSVMQQHLQPLISVSKDPDDESMYHWSFKTDN